MANLDERFDVPQYMPYTPAEIAERSSGVRPSVERLLQLVDTTDPAFLCIAEVLRDMRAGGIELNDDTISVAITLGRQKRSRSRALGRRAVRPDVPSSIVYYVRRGHAIKIGTTSEPAARFSSLMPDEIMAYEPGSYQREAQRHSQFLHLRIGRAGEYFTMADELLSHVSKIRKEHGDPHPSWPSLERKDELDPLHAELPEPRSKETAIIADGARILGIKAFSVYGWARRGRMPVAGIDDRGRRLYYLEHMAYLHKLHEAWRR